MGATSADSEIVVTAVGMPSSVGLYAAQTFASVRAGICRWRELPEIYQCDPGEDDDQASPLIGADIGYLSVTRDQRRHPSQWLARLAAEAFFDLQRGMGSSPAAHGDSGFFLALPGNRPGWDAAAADLLLSHFHDAIGVDPFDFARLSFAGHPGALSLCVDACDALRAGEIRQAIVGGVDSYLFYDWLQELDRDYRIKTPRNVSGFVPGEGAAFFLLERAGDAASRGRQALAALGGVRTGKSQGSDLANSTAVTLCELVRPLVATCPEPPLVLCDLNGEPARTKEWGYALTRLGRLLGDPVCLEHPAAILGDCGAATGAALVVLATFHLQKRQRGKSSALIWSAGDDGDRATMLLTLNGGENARDHGGKQANGGASNQ